MAWGEAKPPQQASHDASTPLLDMTGPGSIRCLWRCARHSSTAIADFVFPSALPRRHPVPFLPRSLLQNHPSPIYWHSATKNLAFLVHAMGSITPPSCGHRCHSRHRFPHHFPYESRDDSVPLDQPLPRSIRHAATLAYGLAGLSFISVAAVAAGLWAKTYEGLDSTKVLLRPPPRHQDPHTTESRPTSAQPPPPASHFLACSLPLYGRPPPLASHLLACT